MESFEGLLVSRKMACMAHRFSQRFLRVSQILEKLQMIINFYLLP